MPFGLRTLVGPGRWNRSPWERAILKGEGPSHCIVYRHSAVICAKKTIEMPFWLCAWMGPRNHVRWGSRSPWEGTILGERGIHCKVDFVPSAVQKRLKRSICRLGCGLGWAKGSRSSFVFTRWCQCAFMEGHIGANWEIQLNCLSADGDVVMCQITLTTCYYICKKTYQFKTLC